MQIHCLADDDGSMLSIRTVNFNLSLLMEQQHPVRPRSIAGDPVGLVFSNLDSNLFWNQIFLMIQQRNKMKINGLIHRQKLTVRILTHGILLVGLVECNNNNNVLKDTAGGYDMVFPSPDATRGDLPAYLVCTLSRA